MGHAEAADLLQDTLDEEKGADRKLSALATGGINQEAAGAAHSEGEEIDDDRDAEDAVGSGKRSEATAKRPNLRAL